MVVAILNIPWPISFYYLTSLYIPAFLPELRSQRSLEEALQILEAQYDAVEAVKLEVHGLQSGKLSEADAAPFLISERCRSHCRIYPWMGFIYWIFFMIQQRSIKEMLFAKFFFGGWDSWCKHDLPPDTHLPLEGTSESISPNPHVGTWNQGWSKRRWIRSGTPKGLVRRSPLPKWVLRTLSFKLKFDEVANFYIYEFKINHHQFCLDLLRPKTPYCFSTLPNHAPFNVRPPFQSSCQGTSWNWRRSPIETGRVWVVKWGLSTQGAVDELTM